MMYLRGKVYACGKGPMERVTLTDMERYRLTLKRYTLLSQPIWLDTSQEPKISIAKIKIARTILVGGGALPGLVRLY
jgi:hypothetical protein